jgi:hypothetical protein
MSGELMKGDSAASWSRRDVADIAVILIGFGQIVVGVNVLILSVFQMLAASIFAAFPKANAMLTAGDAFLLLFLGLWLTAHHRKISTRLFPAAPGVPTAERRVTLAFGIKVFAVYLAAFAAVRLFNIVAAIIGHPAEFLTSGRKLSLVLILVRLDHLAVIAVCLYFLKRPGWLVRFAYPEGEADEDA